MVDKHPGLLSQPELQLLQLGSCGVLSPHLASLQSVVFPRRSQHKCSVSPLLGISHAPDNTDFQSEGNHCNTVSRIQLEESTGSADPRQSLTKQDQQSHVTVVLIKEPCQQATRQVVADVAHSLQLEGYIGTDC